MKLKRDFLICAIIIIIIIFLDIIINDHFEREMNVMQNNISDLQELVEENGNGKEKVEELKKNWERFDFIAAYYTEHNELEKVSLKLNLVKKNIEIGKNDMTVEYLEELKFLLNHICEKDKLSLKNIF